tara:strand:+ start:8128 stop:8469 length:342 start_codon:yes stop_codon:yes gene_type:complete
MKLEKNIFVYNELAEMWQVTNPELFETVEDSLLRVLYKSTLYEYRLGLAYKELVEKGYFKDVEIPFEEEGVKLGLDLLTEESIKRFGKKTVDEITTKVDLSFEKNKPEIPDNK